jgi:hypothetical protein
VEEKLAGRADHVTEYGIGLDRFEKPTSFDPRLEVTVRVEMSRLRRALAEHYESCRRGRPPGELEIRSQSLWIGWEQLKRQFWESCSHPGFLEGDQDGLREAHTFAANF